MFPLRRVLRLCKRHGECWFLQNSLCHRYNLSPMGIELIRGCVCRTRQPPIFLPSQRPPRGYGTAQCCPRTTEVYGRLPPNRATKQTTVAYLRFWWFALLTDLGPQQPLTISVRALQGGHTIISWWIGRLAIPSNNASMRITPPLVYGGTVMIMFCGTLWRITNYISALQFTRDM